MSITSFAERLRDMAKGSASIDIAQFAFVGLEEIERAYGDRWQAQKARVFEIAHDYLSKRLSPADVLIKGGGGFIIVSGSGGGAEQRVAAAGLAHGLNDFFLGEVKEAPPPRIGMRSSSVDVEALIQTLGNAAFVSAPLGAQGEHSLPATGVEWGYQPVWDVRREALGSYYLVPYSKQTGSRLPGYQFELSDGPPQSFVAIDEASLFVAEQSLRDLFERERRALVGATIHSSSLTNVASRARLFKAMEHFDKKVLRYKTIKIANIVPGFPRMYLDEIAGALKQRVPNFVISAAWDEPDIAGLLQSGPVAIGFAVPLSVLGSNSLVPLADLLSKIRAAVEIAHAAKKLFFVEGQISRELAVRLSAIGVDNISSPRIWPACSAPESAAKWPADKLLAA